MIFAAKPQLSWAYPPVAFILTLFNWPLARFPHQDSMYNDQILLSRVRWAAAALKENPAALIDFTQGLGASYRADVKVIPHFFDPAVFFSLFLDPFWALALRNMLLIFICLYFLGKLWELYSPGPEGQGLRVALTLFYVLSPQFFQQVGHHFVAIFYALPPLLYFTRRFAFSPRPRHCVGLVLAQTLLVGLSDLHIAFFLPIFLIFMLAFDRELRRHHLRRLLAAFAVGGVVVLFSYAGPLRQIFFHNLDVVKTTISWDFTTYWDRFLKRVPVTFFTPRFVNPTGLYVLPLLLLIVAGLKYPRPSGKQRQSPPLFRDLKIFGWCTLLLFALGAVFHGVPQLRGLLPSALRYHLLCLPFLLTLLLIMRHRGGGWRPLKKLRWRLGIPLSIVVVIAALKLKISPHAFFALQSYAMYAPHPYVGKAILLVALLAIPLCYLWPALYGERLLKKPAARPIFMVALATVIASAHYVLRVASGHDFTFVSSPTYRTLYRELPDFINSAIANSEYREAPRSFVPNALGLPWDPNRGRNDKLLPLLEYTELIGGRMFFHWRYSYTRQTSELYSWASERGPANFYPLGPGLIDNTIEFAHKVGAPFLVSADTWFERPDLDLLGWFELANSVVPAAKMRPLNHGLAGIVYLYGIRPVLAARARDRPFARSEYSRVAVRYQGLRTTLPEIRLPLNYIEGIWAFDEKGRPVEVLSDREGFVVVKNRGHFKDLTVTSWSPLSLLALAAPLAGLSLLLLFCYGAKREGRFGP